MIAECKRRSTIDPLRRFFMNASSGWTDRKKFEDRNFSYYKQVIEQMVRDGDCLPFHEDSVFELSNLMQSHGDFKTQLTKAEKETTQKNVTEITAFLAKSNHVTNINAYNGLVEFLLKLDPDRKFSSMPKLM